MSIVFVTVAVLPQRVVARWSVSRPVSSDVWLQWRGFCSLITNAYYEQGMAW